MDDKVKISKSNKVSFKYLSTYKFSLETFEKSKPLVDIIYPAHNSYMIPDNFLIENYFKIINLTYDQKFITNLVIESTIKNECQKVNLSFLNQVKYHKLLKNPAKKISFAIDVRLINNNLEINNENRFATLIEIINLNLSQKQEFLFDDRAIFNLSYEELYINKNFKKLAEIFNFDHELFKTEIDKTWLPEEIDIWDRKLNTRSLGYIRYI